MKIEMQNILQLYKKGINNNEEFLSETSKFFLENELMNSISKVFLEKNLPNVDKVCIKMKNLCKLEGNVIYIPYYELTDLINFSIMVEKNQEVKKTNESKSFKINSFTDVLTNGIIGETIEDSEVIFESETIKEFIQKISMNYTSDLEIKNGNIIITF